MRYAMIPAAVLASVTFAAHAGPGLGGYSFDYDISGDQAVRPVQAFDNGRSVYIQMSARTRLPPAVMERIGEQVRPVTFRYEYPYLVVDDVQGEIVLALDGRTALVARRASGAVSGAAAPLMVGRAATVAAPVPVPRAAPAEMPPAPVVVQPDYSGEMVFRHIRGSVEPKPTASQAERVQVAAVRLPAPRYVPVVDADAGEAGDAAVVHRVRSGETLARIAARYGVPIKRLAAENGIVNPNLIRVGQAIRVTPGASRMAAQRGSSGRTVALEAPRGKSVEVLRVASNRPLDGAVVDAVKRAVAQQARVVIRGHSAAETADARAAQANASAHAVRGQLVEAGVPEEVVVVASSMGYARQATRVDLVLIGAQHNASA